MARPLRIEFPGGLYHFTSRGDRREAIDIVGEDPSAVHRGTERFAFPANFDAANRASANRSTNQQLAARDA